MKTHPEPIALKEKRLKELKLLKAFYKTSEHDKEIDKIESEINFFNWGIE